MQFLIFEEEKFYASCTLKNKNFAPKQNERDCPMTDEQRYFYFTTLIITRKDVNEYMKHHAEYTKANRFKDIVCKIYI